MGDLLKAASHYFLINALEQQEDDVLVILNMTAMVRHDWEYMCMNKSEWQEFSTVIIKSSGTGDVYNPHIHCELVDEPTKAYKITLNLLHWLQWC